MQQYGTQRPVPPSGSSQGHVHGQPPHPQPHPQAPPPPSHRPGRHDPGQAPPLPPPPPAAPAPPPASAPPASAPTPAPPRRSPDATGHLRLPPGAPVQRADTLGRAAEPVTVEAAHTAAVAVLLIGPAGAGKTTVARHWADTRRVPTAHISLDDVREWVRSGFADPQAGWNEHSEAQYRLARRTCGFAARNFLANGISCILDDAVFPDRPVVGLGGWKRHVGPGLIPVVLLPGLEVVLERNAERTGNRRLSDEEVARIHGRMAGWYGSGLPIIDNSRQDVATTARLLDEAVARSLTSPPAW
ncbi:AAA family ATPase [Streptomyces sp. TRM43335]|uniref:AAA family ATPase n=1 Tax=Streptomyces taklimakanensis TaxID=2569853 RepID=A0A6G2B7E8_9ACTN|nr:AAA family ATPase [Streptomyces taklimakanensis]MTE18180.1 AAA family ATPase [Streptomyces taklimakanensis]